MSSTTNPQPPDIHKKQHHVRHRKRPRRQPPTTGDESISPPVNYFEKLPFELLAEVLMLTRSPQDVLAVARTSKFFAKILVDKTSTFIWKEVRQTCIPASLPEPLSIFTESSYASFIFDGGKCETCGDVTTRRYTSYSLRVMLCKKDDCATKFSKNHLFSAPTKDQVERDLVASLPKLDNTSTLQPPSGYGYTYYYNRSGTVRKSDYDQAYAEYLQATLDVDQTQTSLDNFGELTRIKIDRMKTWMQFCKDVQKWSVKRSEESKRIINFNRLFGKSLAQEHGWEFWHLNNTPTFSALFRSSNRCLHEITRQDYDMLQGAIELEQLAAKERRSRRDEDLTFKRNNGVIRDYHDYLRASQTNIPIPDLQSFRDLPIMQQLRRSNISSPSNSSQPNQSEGVLKLQSIQKSPVLTDLIKVQVSDLRDKAKEELGQIIGQGQWKTASSNKLHPVEQLPVRFQCKRCHMVGTRYQPDECLDFAGAFGHTCPRKIKGIVKPLVEWKAERFEIDAKPDAVIRKTLTLYGADIEKTPSLSSLSAPGQQLMCNSCTSGIILAPASVVGHSHRHEAMDVSLVTLPTTVEQAIPHALPGIAHALHYPQTDIFSQTLRDLKVYGCRHCLQVRCDGKDGWIVQPDVLIWKKAAMSWNGLVSHLGTKHEIRTIRDEDVYTFEKVPYLKRPKSNKKTSA